MAKLTLTEKFSCVKAYLENGTIGKMSTVEMIEFCNERLTQIEKKSTKGKKSEVAIENEKLAQNVLTFLIEQGKEISQKEIRVACGLSSPQKTTMVMKVLLENGQVEKTENKGAPYFKAK